MTHLHFIRLPYNCCLNICIYVHKSKCPTAKKDTLLLSMESIPSLVCSSQSSLYWPYLWVSVDLRILLRINWPMNLKLVQLNRSITLAPNTASLFHLQLQFLDMSLLFLICFNLCLPSTSGSSPFTIWIDLTEDSSYQGLSLWPESSFSSTYTSSSIHCLVLSYHVLLLLLLYNSQPSVVAHIYNRNTWEAEAEEVKVQDSLSYWVN